MKIRVFILIFLFLGAFFIISENQLALKERENVHAFTDLYLDWIEELYENSASLTGYIVKMDWLPEK